jgi:hypothetical protein
MNNRSERIIGAVILFSLIAMLFSPCHFGPAKAAMTEITLCTSKPVGDKSLVDQQIQLLQSTKNGYLVDNSYVGYNPSFPDSIGKESVMANLSSP